MRVVFMGTDSFSLPSLKAVIESGVDLLCVVTQPDQPKGRGLKLTPPPVKEFALEHNISIYQPEKVRDKEFVEKIKNEFRPDLIVVVAFGQILPKVILDIPKYGCINIHPSLLPKYRGAAPIQRAIINGEEETGVTLMFVDEGEDTGDIIHQERVKIDIYDTSLSLFDKLANVGAKMLSKILVNNDGTPIETLDLPRYPQDNLQATHAPKLAKEDGLINWNKSALEIHNLIRGTIPWPGAYTNIILNDSETAIKIWDSRLSSESDHTKADSGTIVGITSDSGIIVTTNDINLIINTIQPPNKPKMKAKDFMNGYRLKVGDKFIW
jgi:methionyl-tRNA formyltransferase